MSKQGLHAAILSALLFGMSPVACKVIVGDTPSSLLAGLLYLGSGLGLTGVVLRQKIPAREFLRPLNRKQWAYLVGAIVSGGITAPLFLAYGIRFGTASDVSLLLNFAAQCHENAAPPPRIFARSPP